MNAHIGAVGGDALGTAGHAVTAGQPLPLGVTVGDGGANVAVAAPHATAVYVCLFDGDGDEGGEGGEVRLRLPERTGDIWHGFVAGLTAGRRYGLRADGPWRPEEGHRFNVNKLLLDPYARRIEGEVVWNDAVYGYTVGEGEAVDLVMDGRDSAPFMPRCIAVKDMPPLEGPRPAHPWHRTVIYEAHARGLTELMEGVEGSPIRRLADPRVIAHLKALGVTALELLPVHAFMDDRFLVEKGLSNYWGYQSYGFFAPAPRYMGGEGPEAFRETVAKLHAAGIEVILDVVYNHTAEGDEHGPHLFLKGLGNTLYYRLNPEDPRRYVNDTGTGNTVQADSPAVVQLVMDSLRYWVEIMGVDGFRFDLMATLGRVGEGGFDPRAPLLDAIRQDPVLRCVKLIAEPWDIGPGGYQVGAFPWPFREWNDRFRDDVRAFWRGDPGMVPKLAEALAGSAPEFDHSGRPATTSVNFLTAHDGYTLADVTAYAEKHNEANGEGNRDGHDHNLSDNMGAEGGTNDPAIREARARRRRAMMATLMVAQGVPMILAGDEVCNSQDGNNNAYAQDNPIGWTRWDAEGSGEMRDFTARAIAFRQGQPILGQKRFLHAEETPSGNRDILWLKEDAAPMRDEDWADPERRLIVCVKRIAAEAPGYVERGGAVLLILNAGDGAEVTMPEGDWRLALNSADPDAPASGGERIEMPGQAVLAYVLPDNE
ncbi:glycogen operon protein [Hasllibacter halocynthiae]|uniref:Glycogen operon protein n=1 Tax=Hasllibacter halocynthiae TaxID=595589 RepID=A0A2T0X211_9RHOB|nr:glycogen debranching protein GlgX [Hasllibacter halocynthiae]PRY92986.1 glycogen operon protein [Hasllibacter halocynthiae]